ncbi:hypothetical protein niasHT_023890 [Heterodera trifolii]|uniref:Chloride channel protein n=1 Tax=Heterodera trifolii TaxID=157864 RepID=A0ABD2JCL4_9BILA
MINGTPLSGILKKTDRQYSYENTVLGRYRLEATDGTEEGRQRVAFCESALLTDAEECSEQAPNIANLRRKSVRFRDSEGTHRETAEEAEEEQKQREKNSAGGRCLRGLRPKECMGKARKLAHGIRNAFSYKSIRLLLIDWLFLAILGIGMAMTSMFMDNLIEYLQTFQFFLISVSGESGNSFLDYVGTYLSWLCYTELLVVISAVFVHYVAPQAVGSGIPEMKTILRGVILKDYLTVRTLFSKIVGLTFSLGSGIPIGKMGPFVHVAATAANLLSNLAARFDGAYGNECRKSEMLAAACATGVACTFSAPIGGVLFSIEVTTMYFSVRNYWRGFFAAACGATVFRWLRVVAFGTEVTLVAFYQTHFPEDAFEPEELPFFALIGLPFPYVLISCSFSPLISVFCGFIGAGFIFFYRNVVMFLRQNSFIRRNIQKNWLLYPVVIAFLVASLTYPRGYGRFLSGRYKFTRTVLDFFSNCTWSKGVHHSVLAPHGCPSELLGTWTNHEGYGPYNVFLVLSLFTFTFLVLSALCNTMPIPCGMFMPLFVVGAAFGRLMGEIVSSIFPDGITDGTDQPIFPGIYAVVGAAALTGAVTHSVSPSLYDVMIGIKNLPYLPDIPPSNAEVHLCTAENIMVSKVRFLCRLTQFKEIRTLLIEMPKLRSFPVVDDPASMMLLGSISRRTMVELLKVQIGDEARKSEAEKRIKRAIETIDRHFREAQLEMIGQQRQGKSGKKRERKRDAEADGGKDADGKDAEAREKPSRGKRKKGMMRRSSASDTEIAKMLAGQGADKAAQREGIKKKHSLPNHRQVFPVEEAERRKEARESSRFTVEPAPSVPKRRCLSSAVGPMLGATRNRRNAMASSSAIETKMDEEREECQNRPENAKKSSCPEMASPIWGSLEHQAPITRNLAEYVRTAKKRLRMVHLRHKETEERADYDLTEDERSEWEAAQFEHQLEIDDKLIDPAPFQLVRRTSVYKVHYLFSLLDLERAYVTERGRLVGVVALRDLRMAIQSAQNGISLRHNLYDSVDSSSTGTENSLDEFLSIDVEKGTAQKNGEMPQMTVTECDEKRTAQKLANQTDRNFGANAFTAQNSLPLQIIEENKLHQRNRSQSTRNRWKEAEESEAARAMAYLRRKSVALEDLKALEETPLPTTAAEKEMEK